MSPRLRVVSGAQRGHLTGYGWVIRISQTYKQVKLNQNKALYLSAPLFRSIFYLMHRHHDFTRTQFSNVVWVKWRYNPNSVLCWMMDATWLICHCQPESVYWLTCCIGEANGKTKKLMRWRNHAREWSCGVIRLIQTAVGKFRCRDLGAVIPHAPLWYNRTRSAPLIPARITSGSIGLSK